MAVLIADKFKAWETECNDRFNTLKANEEELNRIFIEIYGLQDELTPGVEDKDVTVRKADLGREIRSFISYAVGCMFGRYSLDVEGLVYAGGEWPPSMRNAELEMRNDDNSVRNEKLEVRNEGAENAAHTSMRNAELEMRNEGNETPIPNSTLHIPNSSFDIPNSSFQIPNSSQTPNSTLHIPNSSFGIPNSPYKTIIPDADNILPITDDEYFEDDILGKFVDFVRKVYGAETCEANLKFIADALGMRGNSPREVIRGYFLNGFYKDHVKIYQKRPIYWLFDSGKENGFKALIYMHRYQPQLLTMLRTEYIHELQERYRTQIAHLEYTAGRVNVSEKIGINRQLEKLRAQAAELAIFEEKVHHLADQMIVIDLDDGVKVNYAKFGDVLAGI